MFHVFTFCLVCSSRHDPLLPEFDARLAAAVQAEGMALVVDQALLATAAAAAASQVASGAYDQDPHEQELHHHHDAYYSHHHHHDPTQMHLHHEDDMMSGSDEKNHDTLLEQRRIKDRKRYAGMTEEQRAAYNAHRRQLYHKQGDMARKRRRERERSRYHSLEGDAKKDRNARRAKLERDRYNKLSKEELEMRNARRRERAKMKKVINSKPSGAVADEATGLQFMDDGSHIMHIANLTDPAEAELKLHHEQYHHLDGMEAHHQHLDHLGVVSEDVIADAVSAAAEVAEQAIGAMMDENAEVVAAAMDAEEESGDPLTIEI